MPEGVRLIFAGLKVKPQERVEKRYLTHNLLSFIMPPNTGKEVIKQV
jgi:hypothetical protein